MGGIGAILHGVVGERAPASDQALMDTLSLALLGGGPPGPDEVAQALSVLVNIDRFETRDPTVLEHEIAASFARLSHDGGAQLAMTRIAAALPTAAARDEAFSLAALVQHGDGYLDCEESVFLDRLADALGLDPERKDEILAAVERELAEAVNA